MIVKNEQFQKWLDGDAYHETPNPKMRERKPSGKPKIDNLLTNNAPNLA